VFTSKMTNFDTRIPYFDISDIFIRNVSV